MGVSIDTYVFQDRMGIMFQDMLLMCLYKDDLVVIRNDVMEKHSNVLDDILLHKKQ